MGDLLNSQGTQEQEAPYPDTKFTKFFGRLYAAVFVLFAIAALSVFVLPENILDVSAACADFVKFMKRFFQISPRSVRSARIRSLRNFTSRHYGSASRDFL